MVGRFQFLNPHEPRGRIPVSETGYRSYFAPMPEIEAAPSPQEYTYALAPAFICASTGADREDADPAVFGGDQLTLF